jgi:hypothetical protein
MEARCAADYAGPPPAPHPPPRAQLCGREWEGVLAQAGVRLPPFNAAACLAIMSRVQRLDGNLPITIK